MQGQNFIRVILFILFCGIGLAVLTGSVLLDELIGYYSDKVQVESEEKHTGKLKSLNVDYDVLLEQLKKDPNFAERIAAVTLGPQTQDDDTIYPKATPEQLAAARKALTEKSDADSAEPAVPDWLQRISEPKRRILLFVAGGFLILISFICFGPMKETSKEGS
ncbi:hypothetical protein ACFL3G_10295 [Planctomycetota bacterium]